MNDRTPEEWDTSGWDVRSGTCEHCGRERPVVLLRDPFSEEVHTGAENPKTWWCRECFRARKDDV